MNHHLPSARPSRRLVSALLAVAVLTATMAFGALDAGAAGFPGNTLASDNPINNTPRVMNGAVFGIERSGSRVFAGGTFVTVRNSTSNADIARNRLMSYNHSTGVVDSWAPNISGTVNAIALSTDGNWLYAAGNFSQVNGVASRGIAKISTTTGQRDPNFTSTVAGGNVSDLELRGETVYITGSFTSVRGTARVGLAALSATNGAVLPLNIPVTVPFSGNTTAPRKIDIDHTGTKMVLIGNFRVVGGVTRPQLAVIDLAPGGNGSVSTVWNTSAFSTSCNDVFDTYMRDIEISPDGTWFAINTTGSWGGAGSMCDTTSRWELGATGTDIRPTWVDFTGGDTLYGLGITNEAIYVGGHQRWQNNSTPPGGDQAGPGAVARPGISALDPLTGVPLSWNPGKERGVGTFAITPTADALYIGHDTQYVKGEYRPRLTAFPMTTAVNPDPQKISLPVNLFQGRADSGLRRADMDGTSATNAASAASGGLDWSRNRGAFVQNGQLFSWNGDGTFSRRSFNGSAFGAPSDLIAAANYVVAPPVNFTNVRAAAYDNGRLYYLRDGDNRLFWRWFSIESGIAGSSEFVASGADWSGVTGIEIAGGWLYSTRDDAKLYRSYVAGGSVVASSRTLVDDSIDWSQGTDLFFTQATGTVTDPPPPGTNVTCGAQEWTAQYFANTTLSGIAETTRCEGTIDYNWGNGAPQDAFVGPDQFSVRWTRTIEATSAGRYTFTARADDGVRISVNGQQIMNEWRDQGPTNFSATVDLGAGSHTVVVEYYENGGGAEARVAFSGPPPAGPVCAPGEFSAQWYDNRNLEGAPVAETCDGSISYDWGVDAPAVPGVPADNFSTRWTTTLNVPMAAPYTFTATADDGVRVFVDDVAVIDAWVDQGPTTYTGTVTLTPGAHSVRVEYYDSGFGAMANVAWSAGTPIRQVGLVVPSPTALGSDQALADRIVASGAQVTVLDDNTVDPASVADLDAVVISGRVAASAIGTRLNTTTTAIVVAKAWLTDDLRMSAGGSAQGTATTTAAVITDPSNPLAAGLNGTQDIFSVATAAGFGTPSVNGFTVATVGGRSGVWGYLPGARMSGTTDAAGCRLALPFEGDVAARITPVGWSLFDAAVQVAVSTSCDA